jgi:hypothetical protein
MTEHTLLRNFAAKGGHEYLYYDLYYDNSHIYGWCPSKNDYTIVGKISKNGKRGLYCRSANCMDLITEEEIAERIKNSTYEGDLILKPICLECKQQIEREQLRKDITEITQTLLEFSTNPISLKSLEKLRDYLQVIELKIREELTKEVRNSLEERGVSIHDIM